MFITLQAWLYFYNCQEIHSDETSQNALSILAILLELQS